jgi:hypothetical protein
MLHVQCAEHFEQVNKFADAVGAHDRLHEQLDFLARFACSVEDAQKTRCYLHKDFAPYSFEFTMQRRRPDGGYEYWFNGGLIYSGPGQPLDGSAPALTVSLDPEAGKQHDWSVHT